MILEYVLGETQSYCLQISRAGTAMIVIPADRQRIEDLVEKFLAVIRSSQPERTLGKELFALLLQPVIGNESRTRRLTIVPDGILHRLPFDALTDEQGTYVLETHVITYAPSATVLYLLRSSRPSNQVAMNFLVVGDVVYSRPAALASNANRAGDSFDFDAATLPNLPGSREEVISAAGIIKGPAQLLLESNATEAAFKAQPLSDFRSYILPSTEWRIRSSGQGSARFAKFS